MHINKARMKLVAGSILLGLAVTLASAYRRSEFDFYHDLVFPCIFREHLLLIPVRQTDYGFPAYWFSSMEFTKYGYEPILGHACAPYVTYSLLYSGFLIDVTLYAICCGILLHFGARAIRPRQSEVRHPEKG